MTTTDMLDYSVRGGASFALSNAIWYMVAAGAVWLCFYVLFRQVLSRRRILETASPLSQVGREVYHSLRSLAIFGIVAGVIVYVALSGWTRIYVNIEDYGWGWFAASLALMIVIHDTYFYWTHRLMH